MTNDNRRQNVKPKTENTTPIDRFELRYELHPGLSDARHSEDWTEHFPATRAGLALAMDRGEYECLELHGSYGAAGAAVYAVMGTGAVAIVAGDDGFMEDGEYISERRAGDLLLVDGTLDPRDVHALHTSVWDGNNHVPFIPSRSLRFLSGEAAYERKGHALIRWNEDGCVDDIRLDEGWDVADEYWGTLGNEPWTYGDHDVGTREELLTAAEIAYDTVWLSDDDIMILVPTADVERAQAVFDKDDD